MDKYINANHLIKDIEQSRAAHNHNNAIAQQTHNGEHRHFIKMVLDQPIADVIEVVRCKDCKYHEDLEGGVQCQRVDGLLMNFPDDYCSYGRRKEN